MKLKVFGVLAAVGFLAAALAGEDMRSPAPAVPYPDGYRSWRHVSSGVLEPQEGGAKSQPKEEKIPAPHGLLANIYANDKAVEGYRTGHFPEGAALAVDWFVLEKRGPELLQGPRKSINVMVRDARYTETGGWGFEDFDRDSHTTRNVGPKAVTMCYECHSRFAKDHEFVFTSLKP